MMSIANVTGTDIGPVNVQFFARTGATIANVNFASLPPGAVRRITPALFPIPENFAGWARVTACRSRPHRLDDARGDGADEPVLGRAVPEGLRRGARRRQRSGTGQGLQRHDHGWQLDPQGGPAAARGGRLPLRALRTGGRDTSIRRTTRARTSANTGTASSRSQAPWPDSRRSPACASPTRRLPTSIRSSTSASTRTSAGASTAPPATTRSAWRRSAIRSRNGGSRCSSARTWSCGRAPL